MEMRVEVECYAGYRGSERPLRFVAGGKVYCVERIEDRWYEPKATYFRVLADDGHHYLLRHDQEEDAWSLCGFRAGP